MVAYFTKYSLYFISLASIEKMQISNLIGSKVMRKKTKYGTNIYIAFNYFISSSCQMNEQVSNN